MKVAIKNFIQNLVIWCVPFWFKNVILNALGHCISRRAKIGFIVIRGETRLILSEGSRIGSFNVFSCNTVELQAASFIRRGNSFSGRFNILLGEGASIGNLNRFIRGKGHEGGQVSVFSLGTRANITSGHYFDLTSSIQMGRNTVAGGVFSQFWTHGFRHLNLGDRRIRVDGAIVIGDGVYIGSKVVFNPGVRVASEVAVGSGAVVAKDLLSPGLYVCQRLRHITLDDDNFLARYGDGGEEGETGVVLKK